MMKMTHFSRLGLTLLLAVPCTKILAEEAKQSSKREEGALVFDGIPEASAVLKARLEQYENVRSAALQAWLKDELLITTRFGDTNQIHKVSGPLMAREQLSFGTEPISAVNVRPKTEEIYFVRDIGGNEFTQFYRLDLANGKTQLLTDGTSKNTNMVWQKDGKAFAFSSTKRNKKDGDIYLMRPDQKADEAQALLTEGGSWTALDWNDEGTELLVQKEVSATENFTFILNLKTKKLKPVLAGGGFAINEAIWAKDGNSLFLVTDKLGEFQTLYTYSLADESLLAVTQKIPWDIQNLELSHDGQTLAFVANEGGIDALYFYDLKKKTFAKAQGLPIGVIGKISFPENRSDKIAFSLSHAKAPSDVFTYDLKRKTLETWTKSETGGLNRNTFVNPKLISFPSFDLDKDKPRQIPAFYYPSDKSGKGNPSAVVILIHGGPESQFQPGFNATVQAFAAELGISVIAPNVRGSSGYGKTYLGLDNGFKREDSVKDIGALIEWIGKQKELDKDRILVMGGSYGGYMTLASLTHYSDKLAGGIDTVGISHFVTFLENTQAYRQDLRRVEYGDERDPKMREFQISISPLTNVAKIKKPLLVVQGLNDPRVPASEAEQIVKAVRSQGLESWYLLAKDEGHGFQKKKNQAAYLQTVMLFAEKILLSPSKIGSVNRP